MIIARLADPGYSILARDHITKNSMWEWGLDSNYDFHFRDISATSYMSDWSKLYASNLYIDPGTYNHMLEWVEKVKKDRGVRE